MNACMARATAALAGGHIMGLRTENNRGQQPAVGVHCHADVRRRIPASQVARAHPQPWRDCAANAQSLRMATHALARRGPMGAGDSGC